MDFSRYHQPGTFTEYHTSENYRNSANSHSTHTQGGATGYYNPGYRARSKFPSPTGPAVNDDISKNTREGQYAKPKYPSPTGPIVNDDISKNTREGQYAKPKYPSPTGPIVNDDISKNTREGQYAKPKHPSPTAPAVDNDVSKKSKRSSVVGGSYDSNTVAINGKTISVHSDGTQVNGKKDKPDTGYTKHKRLYITHDKKGTGVRSSGGKTLPINTKLWKVLSKFI
ncbi:hypothetical protein AAE478_003840 [Parahypoxylon ruwenzoriense]